MTYTDLHKARQLQHILPQVVTVIFHGKCVGKFSMQMHSRCLHLVILIVPCRLDLLCRYATCLKENTAAGVIEPRAAQSRE
jgi:hypothetical protein